MVSGCKGTGVNCQLGGKVGTRQSQSVYIFKTRTFSVLKRKILEKGEEFYKGISTDVNMCIVLLKLKDMLIYSS